MTKKHWPAGVQLTVAALAAFLGSLRRVARIFTRPGAGPFVAGA
ncbi:MAG TPA: hypothetical protein VFV95_20925 [Vicinamibacterales bacterium]|nr:hypothetical protein [Vicinamibacterales bacterium]